MQEIWFTTPKGAVIHRLRTAFLSSELTVSLLPPSKRSAFGDLIDWLQIENTWKKKLNLCWTYTDLFLLLFPTQHNINNYLHSSHAKWGIFSCLEVVWSKRGSCVDSTQILLHTELECSWLLLSMRSCKPSPHGHKYQKKCNRCLITRIVYLLIEVWHRYTRNCFSESSKSCQT